MFFLLLEYPAHIHSYSPKTTTDHIALFDIHFALIAKKQLW